MLILPKVLLHILLRVGYHYRNLFSHHDLAPKVTWQTDRRVAVMVEADGVVDDCVETSPEEAMIELMLTTRCFPNSGGCIGFV